MLLKETNHRRPLPSSTLVLMAIASTQMGTVLAKQLFNVVGHTGAISISLSFAALLLLLWHRPKLHQYTLKQKALVATMGLVLAGMYLCLYGAIDRIPLGIAIAIQFAGPLSLSAFKSCRGLDLVWVTLAATGIALLSPFGESNIDPVGAGLALLSGLLLAVYIALAAKTGSQFHRSDGLTLAVAVSAVSLLPVSISASRELLMFPGLLLVALGVAILSAVVPFSLDLMVLKRTSARTFGILLSLEPAIASLIGWLVLSEQLVSSALVGIGLIMLAAVGHSRFQSNC